MREPETKLLDPFKNGKKNHLDLIENNDDERAGSPSDGKEIIKQLVIKYSLVNDSKSFGKMNNILFRYIEYPYLPENHPLPSAVLLGDENLGELAIKNRKCQALNNLIHDAENVEHAIQLANGRLVYTIATKYLGRNIDFQDLFIVGNIGLGTAIKMFNPELGYLFSTYATWWIRQSMTRLLADEGNIIRTPVHMYDKLNTYTKTNYRLEQRVGRNPTLKEVAEKMNISVERVQDMITYRMQQPSSLNIPVGEEVKTELGDLIPDTSQRSVEEEVELTVLVSMVKETLSSELTAREKMVLTLRFGLEGKRQRTLEETGRELGVTRERARQIEDQAIRKLRHSKISENFRDFWK